jgi:radical SAM protein with 4Fe4S-binding SPASM domain
MMGIERLLARDLPLKLKSMVLTLNQHEIRDMEAYARGLGLEYRIDAALNLRLDGAGAPAAFRIAPQEVLDLDLADERRTVEWREFCKEFLGVPAQPEYLYQCGAGLTTCHVDAYGRLSACMMARDPGYDLRAGTFCEGWHEFIPPVLAQTWSRETSCRGCELTVLCGQCPGFAQIESGDQEAQVAYLCQIAHLRAEAFGSNGVQQEESDGKRVGNGDYEATLS